MNTNSARLELAAAGWFSGRQHRTQSSGGSKIALFEWLSPRGSSPQQIPLLLVHSVNATASAFEMEGVAKPQSLRRAVWALDLPGFGASEKPEKKYTPGQMREAIETALSFIQHKTGAASIDLMALSLGCEFAAEAAVRKPARIRSLTLISPTGMEGRRRREHYEEGKTRELAFMRRLLTMKPIGQTVYKLVTTRPSMRFFLARAWGRSDFDRRLLAHGLLCASLPGARHAPLDFAAGALFTRGIIERYRALPLPVWVVHGTKGAFTDFGACPDSTGAGAAGRSYPVQRTVFETGSMPHLEVPHAFDVAYERFMFSLGTHQCATPSRQETLRADAVTNPSNSEVIHER